MFENVEVMLVLAVLLLVVPMGCSYGGELARLSGTACFVEILATHKVEMCSYEKQASSIA